MLMIVVVQMHPLLCISCILDVVVVTCSHNPLSACVLCKMPHNDDVVSTCTGTGSVLFQFTNETKGYEPAGLESDYGVYPKY